MKRHTALLLPPGILLVGLAGALALNLLVGRARREPRRPRVTLVTTIETAAMETPAIVRATGVVAPASTVTVTSQVGGKVVWQSRDLLPGGRFKKGELLARIDPRDYELALHQQESLVRQAELDLELETRRQVVAQREWELLGDERSADDAALALRKPYLETAELALEAARSGLEQARLDLERTELHAPFDSMIIDEWIDVGQVLTPSTPVASLVGSHTFRVMAYVPVERLELLEIPGVNSRQGSGARVLQAVGTGKWLERDGKIVALSGELEPETRRAGLVVDVDDPLAASQGGLPMLPGAFVELEFEGRELSGVFELPASALYNGDTLWIVDDQHRLGSRKVDVGWRFDDRVFVTAGLDEGLLVVTSPLSLPVQGQRVQIQPDHGVEQP